MCGRYGLFADLDKLPEELGFPPHSARSDYRQWWNIAPSAFILVVSAPTGEREVGMMRWGISPTRRNLLSSRLLFNARGETLSERLTFRSAFESRRCLILAKGFYERQASAESTASVWKHRANDQPFTFAGLYAHDATTIITTDANSQMSPTHHRMPAISSDRRVRGMARPSGAGRRFSRPTHAARFDGTATRPVFRAVNRARMYEAARLTAAEEMRRLV